MAILEELGVTNGVITSQGSKGADPSSHDLTVDLIEKPKRQAM